MTGHDAPRGFFEVPGFTREHWEKIGARFPADGGRGIRPYRRHPSRESAKLAQRKIEDVWRRKPENQPKVKRWIANYQEKRLTRLKLKRWLKRFDKAAARL
jgi:hypothetical protein